MFRYSTGGIFCIFLLYKSQKLLPNNPALEYFICLDIPLVEYFAKFLLRARNVTKYSSFGVFHMLKYSTGGIFCIFLPYKSKTC